MATTKMLCYEKALLALLLLGGIFFLSSFGIVFAHGDGASVEKIEGEYLLDIGYSPDEVEVGAPIRFDFNIAELATSKGVAFTDIWLRITKEEKVFFAGGLNKARLGVTGVTYVFPEAGKYKISVRFQNQSSEIAETEFPFTVLAQEEASEADYTPLIISFLLGVALSGGLVWSLTKQRSRQ